MFPRRGGQQDLIPEMLRKRSGTDYEGPCVFSEDREEAACSEGETFNILSLGWIEDSKSEWGWLRIFFLILEKTKCVCRPVGRG